MQNSSVSTSPSNIFLTRFDGERFRAADALKIPASTSFCTFLLNHFSSRGVYLLMYGLGSSNLAPSFNLISNGGTFA